MRQKEKGDIMLNIAAILGILIIVLLFFLILMNIFFSGYNKTFRIVKEEKKEFTTILPSNEERLTKDIISVGRTAVVDKKDMKYDMPDITGNRLEDEFIIPDSSVKNLTNKDIALLDDRELNYAKNEIYARHGRTFESKELQDFFESKDWYKSVYNEVLFDNVKCAELLSDVEKYNVEFLHEAGADEYSPKG